MTARTPEVQPQAHGNAVGFVHWGAVVVRHVVAVALLVVLVLVGLYLHEHEAFGPLASFTLIMGAAFGFVLQRSRFCFFCIFRDLIEKRDAGPMMGILVALAVGSIGYAVVLSARIPDATAGWLPFDAFIQPAGWHLLLGGAIFGLGMALSGSCISAHMYRIGEGSLLAPLALLGSIGGFILGYQVWNRLYLAAVADARAVWLPEWAGYALAVAIQIGALGIIAALLLRFVKRSNAAGEAADRLTLRGIWNRIFITRWPAWAGGIAVGLISVFAYMRTSTPLGVTAELNRVSRVLADAGGVMPPRLEGLDRIRGCIPPDAATWISQNGVFVLSLIGGALVAGLLAGQFRPKREPWRAVPLALLGGVLLGFGAMISIGCTIGTLLSGIHAFALSGWIFLAGSVSGTWLGLKLRSLI